MIAPLPLALLLATPWLLGMLLLQVAGRRLRDDPLAFIAWSWLLGALAVGGTQFVVANVFGARSLAADLCAIAVVACVALFAARRRARAGDGEATPRDPPAPAGTWLGRLAFRATVVVVVLVALAHALALQREVIALGDEAWIWMAKTRALWFADGYRPDFTRTVAELHVGHPDYPPLLPLLQLFLAAAHGAPDDITSRWPAQLTTLALLLATGAALRRRAPPTLAAALLLLLLGTRTLELLQRRAFADSFVALGFLVALDAGDRWLAHGRRGDFWIACAAAAFGVFAKNEGALYVVAVAAAFLAAARSPLARARWRSLRWHHLAALLPVACFAVIWWKNVHFGLGNDLIERSASAGGVGLLERATDPLRLGAIGRHYLETLTFPALPAAWSDVALTATDQNLLYAALLVLLLAMPRRVLAAAGTFTTSGVATAFLGILAVYLATPQDAEWHLSFSLDRVLGQSLPAATVLLGATLAASIRVARSDAPRGSEACPSAAPSASPSSPATQHASS